VYNLIQGSLQTTYFVSVNFRTIFGRRRR